MAKITKTEEQLTKDLEVAIKKLYKMLPGTTEERIQTLRTKFEGEIQQLIQPSQTEKKSKKRELSEEMKAIIDLLRQLKPQTEIAEQYGKHQSNISIIAKNNGIWSLRAVRKLLKDPEMAKMTDQELSDKTGAYPDAIARVRQEIEQEKKERVAKKILLKI